MKHPYQALYHSDSDRIRFERLAAKLCELGHADNEIRYFSAPGRSELGGNHTDHQHGCVLAAAVDVDTIAAVAKNDLCLVRLTSEGYPSCVQSLELSRNAPAKPGSAESLLQGMLAAFAPYEGKKCGLDIFVSSTGKTAEEINNDTERDNFMTAAEAKAYGIVDEVITRPKKTKKNDAKD